MKKDGLLLGAVLLALMSVLSYAQAPVANRSATSPLLPNSSQSHTTLAGLSPNVQAPILNQLGALTAFDGWSGDNLGGGVAVDGNTAVAAGWGWTWSGSGIAYVFVEPSSGWANMTQTAELTTSDGSAIVSVAISGNTIVGAGVSGISGTAYVFVEPATGWANMTETARLTASDGTPLQSVAIDGNTVVGAYSSFGGSAYVFVEPVGGWADMTETAKLTPSNGDGLTGVAISGNTVAAGAVGGANGNGAAYVFVEPAGGWASMTQTAELTASDGAGDDYLGCGIGISGNTVAAGAPNHTVNGNGWQGAVYVFAKPAGGWTNMTQTAELTASDGGPTDQLGNGAAIYGDTVVGGAPQYEPFGYTGNGRAYVFVKPARRWTNMTQSEELVAAGGELCDALGVAVAISNGIAVAGAPGTGGCGGSGKPGAAYVFGACSSASGVGLCPGALTFGTQLVGTTSTQESLTLINTGTAALNITSIVASANFGEKNNCGSSLAAGGSCTIAVAFKPHKIGTLTGTITVTDSASNSPQTVSLSGVGTAVTLSPSSLNFGDQAVGTTSPPQQVTLTNSGTQALTIYGIYIGGQSRDFGQTNDCGTSVAKGGSCTISLTFSPLFKGSKTATLEVKDDGGASPQTVALSGTGTD